MGQYPIVKHRFGSQMMMVMMTMMMMMMMAMMMMYHVKINVLFKTGKICHLMSVKL